MGKEYIYKKQGDGSDSWTCIETDDEGNVITKYMVYENPNAKPIPTVDVVGLLLSLKPEELQAVKELLK